MRRTGEALDPHYCEVIRSQLGEQKARLSLYNYQHYHFHNLSLKGKRILDIGGGTGRFSFYAAAAGAREVVCLEPELDGSSEGMTRQFIQQKELLGYKNVTLVTQKIEDFKSINCFDILFSNASINHIDEEACILLRKERWAWDKYRSIFNQFSKLLNKEGYLIIADSSNPCFYSLLGLKNPFAPPIEWHKHQPPSVWAELASEFGFKHVRTLWRTPARLGSVGRLLLGNRLVNFFLYNSFSMLLQLD